MCLSVCACVCAVCVCAYMACLCAQCVPIAAVLEISVSKAKANWCAELYPFFLNELNYISNTAWVDKIDSVKECEGNPFSRCQSTG